MPSYTTRFIPENKLPGGCINVYNGDTLVGKIKSPHLRLPDLGPLLYRITALADTHSTISTTARTRFQRALSWSLNDLRADFVAIAGDLTGSGTEDEFVEYAEDVGGLAVHDCTGNHDVQQTSAGFDFLRPYTGRSLYYSFEHKGDLWIMFGMSGWPGKTGELFSAESLQWLYETLEANRNRRVFLVEHCPYFTSTDGIVTAGDGVVIGWPPPTGGYIGDIDSTFMQLVTHYRNVVWISGHTHQGFENQKVCETVNYNRDLGFHAVHIPALASNRIMSADGYVEDDGTQGMGYVVEVYANHIVLRGRDFVTEKYEPIATYCLDTTLVEIEAGTFTDSTGLIVT